MKTRRNKKQPKKEDPQPELMDPTEVLDLVGLSPDDTEELPPRATTGLRIEDLESEIGPDFTH